MKAAFFLLLPVFFCSVLNYQNGDSITFEASNEEICCDILMLQLKIDKLPKDVLFNIALFLINPFTSLGRINKCLFRIFHENYTLKQFAMQRFNILELSHVNENEPELVSILDLSWSANPFIFFCALIEDIMSGKRPFKVLFRPLIAYLDRT